jgi:hypothetical protein
MKLPLPTALPKFVPPNKHLLAQLFGISIVATLAGFIILFQQQQKTLLTQEATTQQGQIAALREELMRVKSEDQFVRNDTLEEESNNIQKTYGQAVVSYEELVKLREQTRDTRTLDVLFVDALVDLSRRNWTTASATLATLNKGITDSLAKLAASVVIPANVAESNAPPSGGFSRQSVNAGIGTYLVDIVAADMASTRIIVDTASDATCMNDCPVLSLGEYAARSGAFAGINGSYFCPADYPSCADKKNSFDTLLMNKNKVYFNSDNNVYSTVPAVIFLSGSMRFVGQSSGWGRDTSPDGVIANQPLLLSGGNITFGGDSDPKKGSRGNRSFVGNKGTTAYIGVVHGATVAEVAHVLKALGLENALNLDNGGSTALWSGGYKVGPGRNLPNVILFVRR